MNKCALCLKNDAIETNTHYLTDFVTKRALNQDGSNERDKNLSFQFSASSPFTKLTFKKNTSVEKIREVLGRDSTDQENEESKTSKDYSVDFVFCPVCEKKFGAIESAFANKFIPKFRMNKTLEGVPEVDVIKDIKLFRLFWLMQIWRTSVCDTNLEISKETAEKLRQLIFSGMGADESELKKFPLVVSVLYSGTVAEEQTANMVGVTLENKPNVIFMNDFVIQFFEDISEIKFLEYYGLNDKKKFKRFINCNESVFKVEIKSNEEKKLLIDRFTTENFVKPWIEFYRKAFIDIWVSKFPFEPPVAVQDDYIKALMNFDGVPVGQTLSIERVSNFTAQYIFNIAKNW